MKVYRKNGKLDVICGPMYAGKSEELIRLIKRLIFGKKKIQVFKHGFDSRYTKNEICTHDGKKHEAISVLTGDQIIENLKDETEVLAIDEIQFFDKEIILLIDNMIKNGKYVIVAGLDLDFRGIPFGPMPFLMALADNVKKLTSVCFKSGKDARYSQRLIDKKPAPHDAPVVFVGAVSHYEARSRDEFEISEVPLKEYIDKVFDS